MEDQGQAAKPIKRSQPTVPIHKDFLFVDASEAKTSRQGRRNARSFVMQRARRERPWSTSKHVKRRPQPQESASSQGSGTANSTSTPNTASSSPTVDFDRNCYLPIIPQTHDGVFEQGIYSNCQVFRAQHRQIMCPKCISIRPVALVRGPNSATLDPFRTASVKITKDVWELLDHCKSHTFT